jgi:cystathionine gamma-synthase
VSDIGAIAKIAGENSITLAVDGTWTTPVLQRPFELGADVVVHSLTKYMAGHSDVLGGAVIVREENELNRSLGETQNLTGAVLDPFSCWLTLRGIRSLAVRIRAQCKSATRIATFLHEHPKITVAHYPGIPSHAGYSIAKKQMLLPGGMMSIEIVGGESAAIGVAATVGLFRRATSLGGTESLIEHRASIEGPESTTPRGLLRLSIGLEYTDDLIEDLDQALTKI